MAKLFTDKTDMLCVCISDIIDVSTIWKSIVNSLLASDVKFVVMVRVTF